jgi:hypothetical protein
MSQEGEVKEAVKQPIVTKAQEAERVRQAKIQHKQQEMMLANYKKRVREGNDLKKLQVTELELNIAYYHAKKEWLDLAPKMEELEAQEQAILKQQAEEEKKMREAIEAQEKKESKPTIIKGVGGKPREK